VIDFGLNKNFVLSKKYPECNTYVQIISRNFFKKLNSGDLLLLNLLPPRQKSISMYIVS